MLREEPTTQSGFFVQWSKELITFYKRNYRELKNYELSPFRADHRMKGLPIKRATFNAPFEGQAILNAEFDLGMKVLGPLGEYVFRTEFLNTFENLPEGHFTAAEIEDKGKTVQYELWTILNGFKGKKSRMKEAFK